MTHLPTPQPATTTPCTIRLGELAMAAGMAGMPVALCYQEFPAPILSEVWRHYIRTAGPDVVHHVRTQGDLNKLPERLAEVRLEYLHQGADGYEWYCRMGLVHRPPNRNAWSTASPASLASNLCPWSVKQVRTHFDRFRRDGLLTAERDHENGPCRYELPDELTDVSSPFHDLPPITRLRTSGSDANGNAA